MTENKAPTPNGIKNLSQKNSSGENIPVKKSVPSIKTTSSSISIIPGRPFFLESVSLWQKSPLPHGIKFNTFMVAG